MSSRFCCHAVGIFICTMETQAKYWVLNKIHWYAILWPFIMSQNYWVLFKILVVLFIASCKVVLTFEAVDEMQSVIIQMKAAEQYWFSCGTVNYAAVQGGSNLVWSLVVDKIIQMKASKQYFAPVHVAGFIILCKVFLTSETMDETLSCDQTN